MQEDNIFDELDTKFKTSKHIKTSNTVIDQLINIDSYRWMSNEDSLFIYLLKECTYDREVVFDKEHREDYCYMTGFNITHLSRLLKKLESKGLIEKDGETDPNLWFIC